MRDGEHLGGSARVLRGRKENNEENDERKRVRGGEQTYKKWKED